MNPRATPVADPPQPAWKRLVVGIIGGLTSGLTGVGGGVIMVPLMTGILRMRQKTAQGSSLVIIIPTATVAALVYFFASTPSAEDAIARIDAPLLIPLFAIPAMLTAPFGAYLTTRLNSAQLRRLFAILLLGTALKLIIPGDVGTVLVVASLVLLLVLLVVMLWQGRGQRRVAA
jgi:hypothetical protein